MSRVDRNKNEENRPSSSGGDGCTVKKVLSYRQTYRIRHGNSNITACLRRTESITVFVISVHKYPLRKTSTFEKISTLLICSRVMST